MCAHVNVCMCWSKCEHVCVCLSMYVDMYVSMCEIKFVFVCTFDYLYVLFVVKSFH